MAIAYLVDQGTVVNKEGQRFLVKKQCKLIHALHIFNLEQLIIFGNVSLTPSVISHLLKRGIDTAFMTIHGRYLGRLQSPEGKNILLRQIQYERFNDSSFILEAAKSFVTGKLANQRAVIMKLNRNRTGLNLEEIIYGLKKLIDKAGDAASMETLRGYEGRGAVIYI